MGTVAAAIAPAQMFVVPTAPDSQVVVDYHILFVLAPYPSLSSQEVLDYFMLIFLNLCHGDLLTDTIALHDVTHPT